MKKINKTKKKAKVRAYVTGTPGDTNTPTSLPISMGGGLNSYFSNVNSNLINAINSNAQIVNSISDDLRIRRNQSSISGGIKTDGGGFGLANMADSLNAGIAGAMDQFGGYSTATTDKEVAYQSATDIANRTAEGMKFGALFGPWGALAGAATGTVVGAIGRRGKNGKMTSWTEMEKGTLGTGLRAFGRTNGRIRDRNKYLEDNVNQNIDTLRGTSALQSSYYMRNQLDNNVISVADGGSIPSTLAYLDDGELVQSPNGKITEIPEQGKPTDSNLVDLQQGSKVLSDKLKVPGTKLTFAEYGKKIMNYKKSKGTDKFAENSNKLNEMNSLKAFQMLYDIQQLVHQQLGIKPKTKTLNTADIQTAKQGGKIKKLATGGEIPAYGEGSQDYDFEFKGKTYKIGDKFWYRGSEYIVTNRDKVRVVKKKPDPNYVEELVTRKIGNDFWKETVDPDGFNSWPSGPMYRDIMGYTNSTQPSAATSTQPAAATSTQPAATTSTQPTTTTSNKPVATKQKSKSKPKPKPIVLEDEANIDYRLLEEDEMMNQLPKVDIQLPKVDEKYDRFFLDKALKGLTGGIDELAATALAIEESKYARLKRLIKRQKRKELGLNLGLFANDLGLGLAELAPILANMLAEPEYQSALHNPYADAALRTMGNRRYDIDLQLEMARRNRATANYNMRNMNTNTGANMAYGLQTARNYDDTVMQLLSAKQNAENQYASEYTNMMNDIGNQWVTDERVANEANRASRAAAEQTRLAGYTGLSQLAQTRAKDRSLRELDNAMMPYMQDYLRNLYSDRTIERSSNWFRKRGNNVG